MPTTHDIYTECCFHYLLKMPPKKKKRIDTGVKQGTGRQYIGPLIDNFSEATDTLLNGHVLYIYLEKMAPVLLELKKW